MIADASFVTYSRYEYTFTGSTSSQSYRTAVGSISKDIYLFGFTTFSSLTYTTISRINPNGTVVYTVEYQTSGVSLPSFSLSPDESNIYFLPPSNPLQLATISATTGGLISCNTFSLVKSTSLYSVLILDPSGINIFLGAQNSTPYAYMCKFPVGGSILTCCELAGLADFRTLSYLDQDSIYYTSTMSSTFKMWTQKINFTSAIPQWTRYFSCTSSCGMGHSQSLVNSDRSIIYTLSVFGSSGSHELIMLMYYASNGTVYNVADSQGNVANTYLFKPNLICDNSFWMDIKYSIIYAGVQCTNSYSPILSEHANTFIL